MLSRWGSRWYNADGVEISAAAWEALPHADRVIGQDTRPDGLLVSTVLLGLDHRHGEGPPVIFETLVFPGPNDFREIDGERYCTKAEALAGHQRWLVAELDLE